MTDAVALCIQPASGDSLQFMKAGIMEVPDLAVVTKADLGAPARRAAADLRLAMGAGQGAALPVHLVSSQTGEGVAALFDGMLDALDRGGDAPRRDQARHWLRAALMDEFGTQGVSSIGASRLASGADSPFLFYAEMHKIMANAIADLDFSVK